jgi:hypothetical protein
VAGAIPSVAFEMISAVRGSVIGGGDGGSLTVISKLLDASCPFSSVTVTTTLYMPACSNVCATLCSSLPSLPSPKSQLMV